MGAAGASAGGGGSALPSFADIGYIGTAGSYSFNAGTHTVDTSGSDIWSTEDAFSFAYTTMTGDGTVTARVATQENTGPWAKAGVMIRESVGQGAKHGFALITPSNGVNFIYRTTNFDVSTITNGDAVSVPYWIRLTRSGTTLTAYSSSDGSSWATIGSVAVSMTSSVVVGLAVSSNDYALLNTTTFDNVSMP